MTKLGYFVTQCKRCDEDILLSNENEDDKWRPYEYNEYDEETDTRYLSYHKCTPLGFDTVCKYCDADIIMSERAGRWLPYDDAESGQRHRCLPSSSKVEKGEVGGQKQK